MSDSSFKDSALAASHLTLKYLRVFVWLTSGYKKKVSQLQSLALPFVFDHKGLIGSAYNLGQKPVRLCSAALWMWPHQITPHYSYALELVINSAHAYCNLYQALCFLTCLRPLRRQESLDKFSWQIGMQKYIHEEVT